MNFLVCLVSFGTKERSNIEATSPRSVVRFWVRVLEFVALAASGMHALLCTLAIAPHRNWHFAGCAARAGLW